MIRSLRILWSIRQFNQPHIFFFIDRSFVVKLFCQCSVRILLLVPRTSHALPAKYSCPGCAHFFAATLHKALSVQAGSFNVILSPNLRSPPGIINHPSLIACVLMCPQGQRTWTFEYSRAPIRFQAPVGEAHGTLLRARRVCPSCSFLKGMTPCQNAFFDSFFSKLTSSSVHSLTFSLSAPKVS